MGSWAHRGRHIPNQHMSFAELCNDAPILEIRNRSHKFCIEIRIRMIIMCTLADINECDEHLSNCEQLCINDDGGYHCSCYPGYNAPDQTRPYSCQPGNSFVCDEYEVRGWWQTSTYMHAPLRHMFLIPKWRKLQLGGFRTMHLFIFTVCEYLDTSYECHWILVVYFIPLGNNRPTHDDGDDDDNTMTTTMKVTRMMMIDDADVLKPWLHWKNYKPEYWNRDSLPH